MYPIDIAFAISATSTSANELYTYMKNAITHIIDSYGMYYVHHALMVFGSETYVRITFAQSFNSTEQFNSLLGSIVRVGGRPDLPKALEKVADLFKPGYKGERPNVRKFLVVIVDRNTVGSENVVLRYAKFLENLGIKVRRSYYGLILHVCSFVIKTSVVMSLNPVNAATNKQKEYDRICRPGSNFIAVFFYDTAYPLLKLKRLGISLKWSTLEFVHTSERKCRN